VNEEHDPCFATTCQHEPHLDAPMSQFPKQAVGCLLIVALIVSLTNDKSAQSFENEDDILKIFEYFEKEREAANWPYDKLVKNADTIVIATFESQRKMDFNMKAMGYGDKDTTECIGSKLNILAVLKGDPKAKQIEIMHLKWKPSVFVLGNSSFMSFQSRMPLPNVMSVVLDGKVTGYATVSGDKPYVVTPEYLLFLRRQKDGSYAPASGQRYAGKSSRMINN